VTERKIEILTAIAQQTFVYDPAWIRKDDRGQMQETHKGYRIKAEKLGKSYNREGDVVVGVWADQLTYAAKARRNRALGRINLEGVVHDMRAKGYPDVDMASLLRWFHDSHGDSKGILWNIYDQDGAVAPEVQTSAEIAPEDPAEAGDPLASAIGDEEYLQKQPDGRWHCSLCQKYMTRGVVGHRRSIEHKTNLAARKRSEAA